MLQAVELEALSTADEERSEAAAMEPRGTEDLDRDGRTVQFHT